MINNYKDFKKMIEKLDYRPKLLLHSCCAPCSSYVITFLNKYFDITIFYSNDNIYPISEFNKRLDEEIRFCLNINPNIKVIHDEYVYDDYLNAIKGKEDLGEKSPRCYECYKFRLEKTVIKAKELGFDYFTTTLSISPHKNSKWINEIGYELENKYNINYLYSDFKKEEGYKKSIELSKEYGLYRQDYCGCVFSMREKTLKE